MTKLIILGTANAVPDENHYNTHMAVLSRQGTILIDCPGNPILRLQKSGIEPGSLTDLIITHFHPDHTNGIPLLLMHLWLLGRQQPLTIHGLEHSIQRVLGMMELYEWQDWPDFYPVSFKTLPEIEQAEVLENDEIKIFASPVCHLIPTMGVRIEQKNSHKVITYSSDTEPCPALIKLASHADYLIHEAAGEAKGHSSPAQAGDTARKAGASNLLLIHYQTNHQDQGEWVRQARTAFGGKVSVAEDLMEIEF